MKDIWIVNMGIGSEVEQSNAMRVFKTKHDAIEWVRNHFLENAKRIKNYDVKDNDYGVTIGNSFHIYGMNIEAETQTTDFEE